MTEEQIIDPGYKLEKGDTVIGEMPLDSKKLFALALELERLSKQNKLDAEFCADPIAKAEFLVKAEEFGAKCNVLRSIMWIGVRDSLGLWDKSVGVRAGFKIVTRANNDNMPPIFRILGLGGEQ